MNVERKIHIAKTRGPKEHKRQMKAVDTVLEEVRGRPIYHHHHHHAGTVVFWPGCCPL